MKNLAHSASFQPAEKIAPSKPGIKQLGTFAGPIPRHSKNYADIPAMLARVQEARIEAFRAFAEDVAARRFPEPNHQVDVGDEVFTAFRELAERA